MCALQAKGLDTDSATDLVGEGLAQHVLVEGAGEVGVDELAIIQRLAHDAAHKLEEVEVISTARLVVLHNAVGVGLEGGPACGDEQRDVGVEHLPRHHLHSVDCVQISLHSW